MLPFSRLTCQTHNYKTGVNVAELLTKNFWGPGSLNDNVSPFLSLFFSLQVLA